MKDKAFLKRFLIVFLSCFFLIAFLLLALWQFEKASWVILLSIGLAGLAAFAIILFVVEWLARKKGKKRE